MKRGFCDDIEDLPEHKDGIVHRTKQEAKEHHAQEWNGTTTE